MEYENSGTERKEGNIFCPKCGTRLQAGDVFCDNCGYELGGQRKKKLAGMKELRLPLAIGGAAVGSLLGAVLMAVLGLLSNYFIVYPIYTNIMSMDAILGMYRAINPAIENLWQALVVFNLPFTFCKGLISAVVTLLIYRKLEPVINGRAI